MALRELHLFAGAGGGILGGHLLGHECVCAVELDKYCQKVLLQRQRDGLLPWFPIWDDVRTFDGRPWAGRVDVICGGFPCQDISSAGKGAGITGERSGLWSEFARIIGEVRPRYVFVENSPLLTSRGLGTVLGDLAALGFNAEWGVLGAHHAGAPHKRDRIWVLAYAHGSGTQRLPVRPRESRQAEIDLEWCGKELAHTTGQRRREGWPESAGQQGRSDVGECGSPLPIPGGKGLEERQGPFREWAHASTPEVIGGQLNPPWVEKLMGWPRGWTDLTTLPHEEFNAWAEGFSRQIVRGVRQAVQPASDAEWAATGSEGVLGAAALFSCLRESSQDDQGSNVPVESKETPQASLRIMRVHKAAACTPLRSGPDKQRPGEPPNALPVLPRFLAQYGETAWADGSWEDALPRIATKVAHRVDRLKAIGNGQVPQCAALAWRILEERLNG